MHNKLDKQYQALLQDILDNGYQKGDRTGTGTISVFGRQIRHNMKDGFPLLTTKKMYFKGIVTELLWFLRGDTNIKYLVDNDCHIWDGDAYKRYWNSIETSEYDGFGPTSIKLPTLTKEEFINKIKTDDEFAKKWGELGPIYGKQWRSWVRGVDYDIDYENGINDEIDQIANLINDLKTNPDSRRLMVNAWNVGELDQMTLPPCHYGFQVYTRELTLEERTDIFHNSPYSKHDNLIKFKDIGELDKVIPRRAISLMWNQRSVDTFLGLPFNIASYGLLLEIIAKAVNMVPDELIGNLGDTHLYSNHIEQAKEQIGREFTEEEINEHLQQSGMDALKYEPRMEYISKLPKRTREPYPLPQLNINTEWWPYESGECGIGPLDAAAVFEGFKNDNFCGCLLEEDIQLGNYQSHPAIKAPLSN
jgi:thymidylate synthase